MQTMSGLSVVLAVLSIAAVSAQQCGWTTVSPDGVHATYDLSALRASTSASVCGEAAWFSEDFGDLVGETIDYYFCYNFCQNLATPPLSNNVQCTPGAQGLGNVYQLYNNTATGNITRCHVVSYAQNVSWALLDQYNPAMGVVQHYGDGDICYDTGLPREITVQFRCKPSGALPVFSYVKEDDCEYSLVVDSIEACPRECPRSNDQLCSGHGICGGDDDLKEMRCFCNNGWSGDDCSNEGSDGGSGGSHATAVLVAFVIILVIALLVMSVVLWRKIKRLNADDSRYGQLQDDAAPRRPPTAAGMTVATAGVPSAAADQQTESAAKLTAADNV